MIARHVLEDDEIRLSPAYVDRNWEPQRPTADDAPATFRTVYAPNGRMLVTEDLDFVNRASSLGYRCVYEPAAVVGHQKRLDLQDVEAMIRTAVEEGQRRKT